ncbi:MAG: hypothetical protein CSYNP_02104 [Syntrophus sp. SKADARSKE-3]|nr:hypothetical protein [Syntrophus sp. SKADARSKE-3]
MSNKTRLHIGIILLIIGCILPAGSVAVMQTSLPAPLKGLLGGIFFFGFEILAIPAVAIMGKENYNKIITKLLGWLKRFKPAGNVGKVRHRVGVILFILPVIPTYIMGYMPSWLPDNSHLRLYINIASDLMFLISLFVLGGDFWDKLRALFILDARAIFPGDHLPEMKDRAGKGEI